MTGIDPEKLAENMAKLCIDLDMKSKVQGERGCYISAAMLKECADTVRTMVVPEIRNHVIGVDNTSVLFPFNIKYRAVLKEAAAEEV